ncbi:MAG: prolyl oligopeptidase family serine peptidase, partial [Phycisphaerae bacterium]
MIIRRDLAARCHQRACCVYSRILVLSIFAIGGGLLLLSEARAEAGGAYQYPKTRKVDHVDEYHGVKVPDPYRWLEDLDSADTKKWVDAQNRVTNAYLESIPERGRIRDRLAELWNYQRYSVPWKKGGRYFIYLNDGLQNHSVLYTMDSLDGEMRALLDPNKLSEDGTISLSGTAVSEDGKYLAYGLSEDGSDWQSWRVRDIATGKDLEDHLKWIKFSGASWSRDGKGFYYSRYSEPKAGGKFEDVNYYNKLYYHRIGDAQSKDDLIYERPDKKKWGFNGYVTDDGRYLIINVRLGTERNNLIFFKDLARPDSKIVELIPEFKASYSFIDNSETMFWFRTDDEAPKGRVIGIDITKPDRANWKEIIPASRDTLRSVSVVGDRFLATYLSNAASVVKMFGLDGNRLGKLDVPELSSVSGLGGKRSDPETFYKVVGFTDPGTIFRYDVSSGKSTMFKQPNMKFDPYDFQIRQLECWTKDQTRVPIFLIHLKGIRRDGDNPTYMYGYGGFNIPITPRFSVPWLVWMEMGGVFAQPNLRGGGEYGQEWHEAGMLERKQNVFDDFIAAADWLIDSGYTRPDRLGIAGGSN